MKQSEGKGENMIYSSIRTWRKEEQIYTERLHKALIFLERLDPETMEDEKFVLEEGTI